MATDERIAHSRPFMPPWMAHAIGPVLIIALVIALATLAIWTEQMRYRERVVIGTQNLARLMEAQLSDRFDKVDLYLQLVALQYRDGLPVDTADGSESGAQRVPLIDLETVKVADERGIVRVRMRLPGASAESVGDQDFFRRALAVPDSEMVISGPLAMGAGAVSSMVFARAVRSKAGGLIGVAYANMPLSHFDDLFSGLALGQHGAAVLRTDDLRLVHRYPVSDVGRGAVGTKSVADPLVQAMARNPQEGLYEATSPLDARDRVAVYRKLEGYPFYVIVGQDVHEVMAGWRVNALLFMALAGVTIALTLLAWYASYRWARQQIQAMHGRFEAIVQTSSDSIVSTTLRGIVTTWNRGAEQMFGYTASEMLGRHVNRLAPADRRDEEGMLADRVRSGEPVEAFEAVRVRKDGTLIDVSISVTPVLNDRGVIVGLSSITRDISQHKAMQAEIREMAVNDPVTLLPNRRLLMDRLRQAQLSSTRQRTYYAVALIDLDHFKLVNDCFGHDVGDQLLIEVACRLQAAVRLHDTVARLGADKFVLLLEDLGVEEKAAADHVNTVSDKILDTIERDYILDGNLHRCSASIGIRLLVGSQDTPEQVLMDADAAMFRVKHQRRALRSFAFQ
jgi:diguanylate cyclase (GGDEF)-like protein/PAS domain S-box-containing protein